MAVTRDRYGNEIDVVVSAGIAAVGNFVVGGAVDVVEDRSRQALLRVTAELLNVKTLVEFHDSDTSKSTCAYRNYAKICGGRPDRKSET